MLPTPASFAARRRPYRQSITSSRRKTLDFLLTRSRVTNLAVVLLCCFALASFLLNLVFYFSTHSSKIAYPPSRIRHEPTSIDSTIKQNTVFRNLNHLIIVPGHAIWKGRDASKRLDETEWILEPYQRGGGRVNAFFQHISRAAEIAIGDPRTLLVFSGGQTRRASTTTEAESYLRLALEADVFGTAASSELPFQRATTEDHALDSYQNLLFSIARFNEYTGRYPGKITVIGYQMKSARFVNLHRAAIRWSLDAFEYIGVDLEGEDALIAEEGEMRNGYLPYSTDLYGCHSTLLSKRIMRNPFSRYHSYHVSSPELTGLLDWCPGPAEGGSTTIYSGALPWDP